MLDRTLPATKLLQSPNSDIVDGLNIINSLKELSHSMTVDSLEYHNDWYARALDLAVKVNISESKQRTCARQIHRPNHEYKTISDYYLKVLTKELLAHLYNQLHTRFDNSSMISYEGLVIVPSKIISSFYSSNNN